MDKKKKRSIIITRPWPGAVFIAGCIGGPAILVAGLKLGICAAIGGGIMGYTTGKIVADHE